MKEKQILKLKELIKELEAIRGRHTELVSVYIPSGYNLVEIINQLFEEKSTAMNIKSKTTRKNVLSALEKIIQHLKIFKETPPNGLIVFCGNVSIEGKEEIKLWSFEPPERMSTKLYWCDQVFVLDPLKDLIKEKEVYGLIVLDAKEANIGLLKGKKLEQVKHFESTVPSKTVKGGMSQKRYDRIIEDALNEFFKKVGEASSQIFLEQPELKGVIVGGPGYSKEKFVRGNYLHYQIQKKLLGVKDTSYTGEYGLQELVKRSEDLMKRAAIVKERKIVEDFFSELKRDGNVTYELEKVKNALEVGAVETLLISEDFRFVRVKLTCECGFETEKDLPKERIFQTQNCEKCGKVLVVKEIGDLAEILAEKAEEKGSKVEFISVESPEGEQFKKLGGIGAFLRFKIS